MGLCLAAGLSLAWSGARAAAVGEVFQQVKDSVVVIDTVYSVPVPRKPGQTATVGGLGSGVLISEDGKIMTAAHVVQTAEDMVVRFANGRKRRARVIASAPAADVALIKIDTLPEGAEVAPLADSDTVKVGDQVFVVGAPYGLEHTLTVGYISARHRPRDLTDDFVFAELLQTDAAINQGNSGGPMFNMDGQVIGIVSHILSQSGGFEGLGFAVSANTAKDLLLDKKSFWTGAEVSLLGRGLARLLNVPQPAAILVQQVAKGSPAQAMGLRGGNVEVVIEDRRLLLGGDIVLAVEGIRVKDAKSLARIQKAMQSLEPGDPLRVTVYRAGRVIELRGERPE